MEKVRAFDEELTRVYDYECMMSKILHVMFAVFTTLFMLFPFEAIEGELMVSGMPIIWGNMCIAQYLTPFMVVGKMSIYEKLKWMPVSKREIRRVRMEYLKTYCFKLFIIGFSLQQIASILNHSFGIQSLLYALVVYLVIWLGGVSVIYLRK